MRTYKVDLPEGVRKKFAIKIGHKVRLINKLYLKDNKKKINQKNENKI